MQSDPFCLLQVNQIRLPKYADYLHQLVIVVEANVCENANSNLYKWFTHQEMVSKWANVWGPEPIHYFARIKQVSKFYELSLESEFRGKLASKRRSLAISLGYTELDLTCLYSDYLRTCYPSLGMNETILGEFLYATRIDLTVKSARHSPARLFNSFCISNGSYVRFKDLVFALCALEHHCDHGNVGGELRTRCIFGYYVTTNSALMSFNDLASLYSDIANYSKASSKNPINSAVNFFAWFRLDKEKNGIPMAMFLHLVGKLVIRGTASLFRCHESPLAQLRQRENIELLWPREMTIERLLDGKPVPGKRTQRCRQCSMSEYSLAIHSLVYHTDNVVIETIKV